jgi:hypothetical protein
MTFESLRKQEHVGTVDDKRSLLKNFPVGSNQAAQAQCGKVTQFVQAWKQQSQHTDFTKHEREQ